MAQQFTSIECPTCNTSFSDVPVEQDYAALEARHCADCGAILCRACAKFACDGCGQEFCQSHAVSIPDGTARPLLCCAACAAECETAHCPCCDSVHAYTDYIDLGIDPETGYHDEAAVFSCRACGVRGEAEELVYRQSVTELRHIARIAPRSAELAVVARRA